MPDLSEEDIAFLDYEEVSGHEMRGLKILRNAFEFEPTANHDGLGEKMAERLVEKGLAEKGETEGHWPRRGHPIGYKLTNLGWAVLNRGSKPRNYKKPTRRLRTLQPRLKNELPPRLKSSL